MRPYSLLASAAAIIGLTVAAPLKDKRSTTVKDGVTYEVFEHAATGAKLEFVKNSGICEKSAGVNQYSGYLSVGSNMNMWFWFFEARNNPTTAPLAAWFNGGPGCSSMIGLFQENGPCKFENGASTPTNNTNSFNNYANMIYIDQPIGVGFSYGTDSVTSTVSAAPYVWKLLQAFYAQFPQYENRDFGIFTESYGGHYGPEFAYYVQQQNAAIDAGTVTGEKIPIVALGINNGWFDAAIQEKAYIQFSYNNTYKALITKSQYNSYMSTYTSDCLPAIQSCASSGSNSACQNADNTCYQDIEGPLSEVGDFDVYDIREPSDDPYPPATYQTYLTTSSVVKAIGAKSTYQECPSAPYNKFSSTGDNPRSFLATLSKVVQTGLPTLIWAGDADWICNWFGGLDVANAITYSGTSTFANKSLDPYTVEGTEKGTFKTVSNLSFLRVYGAGHEVPYYQPETALQVFIQTMQKKPISST
ncbi:putative carboxypeptidase S1 [Mytilinidion resinicola]|uniref:Carboxypeptidase n=1 Tax=Mytilinidion resinicola TaxID=574789 RepID=A0A6A6YEP5_9PEZI|nr:putative carboxypeptidase S1 [Mytilinidion resinicola]KAF2806525.1 putative carboxypeptidase S1 [Mytilinidion resinicola]